MTDSTSPAAVHLRLVEMFGEVLAGRLDDALALIDPEVVDHRGGAAGDHRGRDAWRRKWEHVAAGEGALRDVSVTVEHNLEAGDVSANRYAIRGTDPASGRRCEVLGMDMVRVRDGRVVEHWALFDTDAMRHQLSGAPDA